jgi:ubiquinone/menaquinone biosynthesis C-methylase UbiE
MNTDNFDKLSNEAHERIYESEKQCKLAETWKRGDTVDAWRHERMYRCLDPLLKRFPGARWMTVGDGRYGTDAHYLELGKANATATDIADTMLRKAKEDGYIREFRKENAERLSFADNSFDFALCKEAYHHFPRPMLALYEMLRVAKSAIVLIEPDESPILMGFRHIFKMAVKETLIRIGLGRLFRDRNTNVIDTGANWYEEVGNFGYSISRREIERVALGMNLPHVAFRGINDTYIEGVEDETATPGSPLMQRIEAEIAEQDRKAVRGFSRARPKLLVAMIFKTAIDADLRAALKAADFDVSDLPRNPYLGH